VPLTKAQGSGSPRLKKTSKRPASPESAGSNSAGAQTHPDRHSRRVVAKRPRAHPAWRAGRQAGPLARPRQYQGPSRATILTNSVGSVVGSLRIAAYQGGSSDGSHFVGGGIGEIPTERPIHLGLGRHPDSPPRQGTKRPRHPSRGVDESGDGVASVCACLRSTGGRLGHSTVSALRARELDFPPLLLDLSDELDETPSPCPSSPF